MLNDSGTVCEDLAILGTAGAMTDFDVYLDTPSPEDAGARTADLYDWQAAVAAADGLAASVAFAESLTLDVHATSIVCEHHEDYGIVPSVGDLELVSVKHRELSSGAWTWAELFNNGGLPHLFARWRALGSKHRCRMVTNAGLDSGQPTQLAAICAKLHGGQELTPGCVTLIKLCATELLHRRDKCALGDDWKVPLATAKKNQDVPPELFEATKRFLTILRLDWGRPSREHIADVAPSRYAVPAMRALGYNENLAEAAWRAVHDVFRERMRSKGATESGGLDPIISLMLDESQMQQNRRTLRRRVVSMSDIITAIEIAIASPAAYTTINRSSAPTVLSMKLRDGGCTSTTVKAAEALAENWRSVRRQKLSDVPGIVADFAAAERRLRLDASECAEAAAAASPSEKYGSRMWELLRARITNQVLRDIPLPRDETLALGGICDLASRCEVWFSDEFDVASAQAQALDALGGGGR